MHWEIEPAAGLNNCQDRHRARPLCCFEVVEVPKAA
jgi:hypothetical protein